MQIPGWLELLICGWFIAWTTAGIAVYKAAVAVRAHYTPPPYDPRTYTDSPYNCEHHAQCSCDDEDDVDWWKRM